MPNIDKPAFGISTAILGGILMVLSFQSKVVPRFSLDRTPLVLYPYTETAPTPTVPKPKVVQKVVPKPKEKAILPKQVSESVPEQRVPTASQVSETPAGPPVTMGDMAVDAQITDVVELFSMPLDQFYPEAAWDIGKEALIVVKILVNTQGKVASVEVIKGDDTYGFVTAAQAWLKTVKFQPIQKDGKAVPFYYVLPIEFKLL